MSPKEKQATPKVAFVFLGPLTKVPPAKAGSRTRMHGEPEFKIKYFFMWIPSMVFHRVRDRDDIILKI